MGGRQESWIQPLRFPSRLTQHCDWLHSDTPPHSYASAPVTQPQNIKESTGDNHLFTKHDFKLGFEKKKKKKGVRYIIDHAIVGPSQSMLGMVIFKQTSSLIDQIFCETICCTTISTSWSLPALVCKLPPLLHSVTHKERIVTQQKQNNTSTTRYQTDELYVVW